MADPLWSEISAELPPHLRRQLPAGNVSAEQVARAIADELACVYAELTEAKDRIRDMEEEPGVDPAEYDAAIHNATPIGVAESLNESSYIERMDFLREFIQALTPHVLEDLRKELEP